MGPASLVGLLILVIALAMVAADVQKQSRESARATARPEDRPIVPPGANDPSVLQLQEDIRRLTSVVGAAVGQGAGGLAGRTAGTGVSAFEVEAARGLGSQHITAEETRALAQASRSAGTAVGASGGANVGGGIGGFFGALVGATPLATIEGFASQYGPGPGGGPHPVAEALAFVTPTRADGSKSVYDVPVAGAVYRAQDWVGSLLGGGR